MIHEGLKAQLDAIKHEEKQRRRDLGSIPDPKEWAYRLPEEVVSVMTTPGFIHRKSYCATDRVAALLRPYGLCDYASRQLSVFGVAVLKELIGEEG